MEQQLVPVEIQSLLPVKFEDEATALEKQALDCIAAIEKKSAVLVVSSNDDYELIAEDVKTLKGHFKDIDGFRETKKRSFLETGRYIDGRVKSILTSLEEWEKKLKKKQTEYNQKLEAERIEKQRLADEAAAKERKRLADEAAAALKKAAEEAAAIRAKAEEEAAAIRKRAAEEAAAATNAAEADAASKRAEDEAARAIQKANEKAEAKVEKAEAKADVLEQQAAVVSAVTVEDNRPQVKGQSTRKVCKGRIVNENKVADHFKVVDQKKVDDFAAATGGRVPCDGIEFYWVDILSSKSR